jgi:integrase/recombinase XerD
MNTALLLHQARISSPPAVGSSDAAALDAVPVCIVVQTAMACQADSDEQLLALWLHGRPANTARPYQRIALEFIEFVGKSLEEVVLADCQRWLDAHSDSSPATYNQRISVLQSLFKFGCQIGYLRWNVSVALRRRAVAEKLASRILTEEQCLELIGRESDPRTHLILRLAYGAGLRCEELSSLTWGCVQENGDGLQLEVTGKGGKTRWIKLSTATSDILRAMKPTDASADTPLFQGGRNGRWSDRHVRRVVKEAMLRNGIEGQSTHTLRHCHASHSLDKGAPVHVVQNTLGHASLQSTTKYLHVKPGDSSSLVLGV